MMVPAGSNPPENPYADDTVCWCPSDWREPRNGNQCPQHDGRNYESERSKHWCEGSASRQPEIDRLKAERDEARMFAEEARKAKRAAYAERDEALRRLDLSTSVALGFAACRAAFDAVVAERDARWQDDNAILQAVIAERDAAITAGQKLAEAGSSMPDAGLTKDSPRWTWWTTSMAPAIAAWRAVSGSSEPR